MTNKEKLIQWIEKEQKEKGLRYAHVTWAPDCSADEETRAGELLKVFEAIESGELVEVDRGDVF
jgi:hypothetical protein